MSKIYVPTEYLNKPCYQINNGYIRVFDTINNNQQNTVYDIYVNQDYMIRTSTSNYSYNTYCDRENTFTDDIYYRTDFPFILLTFFLLVLICFYFPFRLITRLFPRWR